MWSLRFNLVTKYIFSFYKYILRIRDENRYDAADTCGIGRCAIIAVLFLHVCTVFAYKFALTRVVLWPAVFMWSLLRINSHGNNKRNFYTLLFTNIAGFWIMWHVDTCMYIYVYICICMEIWNVEEQCVEHRTIYDKLNS